MKLVINLEDIDTGNDWDRSVADMIRSEINNAITRWRDWSGDIHGRRGGRDESKGRATTDHQR